MTVRRPLLLLPLMITLLGAPAADAARRRGPPDVVEDALAFALTDRSKAIQLLEGSLADGPSSRDLDVIELHAGEQQRLAGKTTKARAHFEAVAARVNRGTEREAALLGMALIDAQERGLDAHVIEQLEGVSDKDALPTQNADRYLVLAIRAASGGEANKVAQHSRRALSWAQEDPEVFTRVEGTLAALADAPADGATDLLDGSRRSTLERAEAAWAEGDLDAARRLAERAAGSDDPEERTSAEALLRVLDGAPVDPRHIAVLLPLSGKYAAVGKHVREALEVGFGQPGRTLHFVDSGATPESAVAALEQAVLDDGAIAVVGPLLSDETEPVITAAEALRVPLLSLSQAWEGSEEAVWALQTMYTREDQVDALLHYVRTERGMHDFALFHPDSGFGAHAAELFEAAVAEQGGTITTKATYSDTDTNLLPFAKKLGKREGNLWQLRKEAEAQGGNPDTVVVPPVIDFDALFLPDSASRTPLACAALAYEEFPMGEFQPRKDSPEVPLLGLSSWNTPSLVAAGNEYTRNSLFPDVFSATAAGEDDPFLLSYRQETGRTPTALEAATVDVGKLLAAASATDAQTRLAFLEALLAAQVPDPVTGASGIDPETRAARRTMRILTITRESIEEVGEVSLPLTEDARP